MPILQHALLLHLVWCDDIRVPLCAQVSGELGLEMAQHADRFVSGVIRNMETSYAAFETVIKQTLRMPIARNGARSKKQTQQAQPPRRKQPARRSKSASRQATGPGSAGVVKPHTRTVRLWG